MDKVATVSLVSQADYQFKVDFGLAGVGALTTDATPPLGHGQGPDSEMLLMAAVGNCLSASLLFALRKFKNEGVTIRSTVDATLMRNEQGRLRVQGIAVDLHLGAPASSLRLVERAVAQYEDFCVVTQSVRAGIPVAARVFDSDGVLLTPSSE